MIVLMFIIVLVISIAFTPCHSSYSSSMFLLGDSVSEKIYSYGLRSLLNCSVVDPRTLLRVEQSDRIPSGNGYVCINRYNIDRIGYVIHWGVGSPPYHHSWEDHRFPNSTLFSRSNILLAIDEFLHRIASNGPDHSPVFVFQTNLWDIKRHYGHKLYHSNDAFRREYLYNCTTMVIEILQKIRSHNGKLVLSTLHKLDEGCDNAKLLLSLQLNDMIASIGSFLHTPVFDQHRLLGECCEYYTRLEVVVGDFRLFILYVPFQLGDDTRSYTDDCIHQSNVASMQIARALVDNYSMIGIRDL